MKCRSGWVSNSSSCSFVIGMRTAVLDQGDLSKLACERIDSAFPDFPKHVWGEVEFAGRPWTETLGHTFFLGENNGGWKRSLDSVLDELDLSDEGELEALMAEHPGPDVEFDCWRRAVDLAKEGFRVYLGSMPHSGDGGTNLQHRAYENRRDLRIDDPDFVLYFQGGLG